MSEADRPADDAGLTGLLAREAVERVLFAYAEHADLNQVDELLQLFIPEATFDFGHGRIFRGARELGELFARLALNVATSHHVSNVVVDVEGDRARARSTVYAFHRRAGSGDEVHLWGRYHDELVLTEGAWRFHARSLRAAAELGTEPVPGHSTFYELIPRSGE